MIPQRRHRDLPDHLAWIITEQKTPDENRRQLIVYLANDIPADSVLEQIYVRQAVRAWQRDHRGGTLLGLPILAGGGWLAQRLLRREVALGAAATVAATGIVFAATQIDDHQATHRPPAAAAPRRSGTRPPSTRPAPSGPPAKPRHTTPAPDTPPDAPDTGQDDRSGVVADTVRSARRNLPDPVRRIVPPRVRPSTPVTVPPPVTSRPSPRCRLVRVEVGKLLRVCL